MTHVNRLLIVLSVLTALIPLSIAVLVLQMTHTLGAQIIWMMY